MEIALKHCQEVGFRNRFCKIIGVTEIFFVCHVVTEFMADTTAVTNNFVVEMKNSDVEGGTSGTEERKSNSESDWQESEWIRKIRSGLEARSGENAGGDVTIKKVPASLRKPAERYTPQQWQFGLHNLQASSESEVQKISLAAVFKLKPDEWDKFCADFVDNPADVKLKSYGIYSVTEPSLKEVQYRLTLDALALFIILSAMLGFPRWLIDGFNIAALMEGEGYFGIYDNLLLCENQIPLALMKKAISKCYGLLPEERKSNDLRELEDPDSDGTKKLLHRILKLHLFAMCYRIFAEPCPHKKYNLFELMDFNYKVGELENCAHLFACFHKVITSCVQKPPIVVTTTFGRAKQLFLRAVGTSSKQLASVIATIFGFSRETSTEEKSSGTDTEHFAPDERDVEALATVGTPPIPVTTTEEKPSGTDTEHFAPDERDVGALATVGTPPTPVTTIGEKSSGTATENFAPDERDVEALATVGTPPIPVTTTFERAKQLFVGAVKTSWKQLASVIATIFGFSRETAIGEELRFFQTISSATDLKKAGLKIRGIPGMVQQVDFKNGCLFLPIIKHSESITSDICNMAAYERLNTSRPFPFIDYLQLMSQLIKTPEDVSYLIHCDVIRPYHGTQKRILQVWQSLNLSYLGYSNEYDKKIVKPIKRHCAIARNVMVTEFYIRYCSKPWLVISVISAIIFFVATLIQTYVLVIGSDHMQPHYPRGG
jgi:hypothetical protein